MYGYSTSMFLINSFIYSTATPTPPFSNTKSIVFDGVDDFMDLGNIAELQSVSNFSISFRVRFPSALASFNWSFGSYTSSSNRITIGLGSTGRWRAYIDTAMVRTGATGVTKTYQGDSATVTVVFDGSLVGNTERLKVYINGQDNINPDSSGTMPATTNTNTDNFEFGGSGYPGDVDNQYIDEVAIFDYSLTYAQAVTIYNTDGTAIDLMNTVGITPPQHYYRCGDDALDVFPNIEDIGTSGANNGVMTNMTAGDIVSILP